MKTLIQTTAVLILFTLAAQAQSYSIDWHKIAGGGGTSTGGNYSLSGTVGQADAGTPMTGGNYSLVGGFWSIIAAVSTPGSPLLTIQLTTTNTVMISWPSPSTGFNLQQKGNLLNSGGWTTPPQTVVNNGTIKYIIVNPPSGHLYYRLSN
jgi:hypothetical protein